MTLTRQTDDSSGSGSYLLLATGLLPVDVAGFSAISSSPLK
jgi:hypothetical protein